MSSSTSLKRSAPSDDEEEARSWKRAESSSAGLRMFGTSSLRREPSSSSFSSSSALGRGTKSLSKVFQHPELLSIVQEYSDVSDVANLRNAYDSVRRSTLPVNEILTHSFAELDLPEEDKPRCFELARKLLSDSSARKFLSEHLIPAEIAFETWVNAHASKVLNVDSSVPSTDVRRSICPENRVWVECWNEYLRNPAQKIGKLVEEIQKMSFLNGHSFLQQTDRQYLRISVRYMIIAGHTSNAEFLASGYPLPSILFTHEEYDSIMDSKEEFLPTMSDTPKRSGRYFLSYMSNDENFEVPSFEMFVRFVLPYIFRMVRAALVFMKAFYSVKAEFDRVRSATSVPPVRQATIYYIIHTLREVELNLDDRLFHPVRRIRARARRPFRLFGLVGTTDPLDVADLFLLWVRRAEFLNHIFDSTMIPTPAELIWCSHSVTPTRIVHAARDMLKTSTEKYYRMYQKQFVNLRTDGKIPSLFRQEEFRIHAKERIQNESGLRFSPMMNSRQDDRSGRMVEEKEREVKEDGPTNPSFDDYFEVWLHNQQAAALAPSPGDNQNQAAAAQPSTGDNQIQLAAAQPSTGDNQNQAQAPRRNAPPTSSRRWIAPFQAFTFDPTDPRGPVSARQYERYWRPERSAVENIRNAPGDELESLQAKRPSKPGTGSSVVFEDKVDSLIEKINQVLGRFEK